MPIMKWKNVPILGLCQAGKREPKNYCLVGFVRHVLSLVAKFTIINILF